MNEAAGSPDSDFDLAFGFVGDEMQIDILSGFDPWDLEGETGEGDLTIAIGNARWRRQKISLGEVKGDGKTKGRKSERFSWSAFSNRRAGISWVVE